MSYNHLEIEAKYIKIWQENNIYKTPEIKEGDRKKYILETFPYPSADGLHVGHTEGYTASDITARYFRANNYKVLYPIGWDAFGLPTENFAKKKGLHPQDVTNNSIKNFKSQVMRLGTSYDWLREINTSEPNYYKWTQWFFQLLYKRGLAYKKEALVNWDPLDQTVLANEQVLPNGTAERSGALVEQKMMSQWFFKITDYAERLITDLDKVDWPESTKQMQKNWIGKSIGAEVDFELETPITYIEGNGNLETANKITVFTTRIDTIFGVTYLVIAPEHPLVDILTIETQKVEVENYKIQAKAKSQFERTEMNKDKTGVFTGSYCINPFNGEKVPIWVGDYVLNNYGTGAVMAVPAHDERDWEFAKKYNLSIKKTVLPKDFEGDIYPELITEKGVVMNAGNFSGLDSEEALAVFAELAEKNNFGNKKITYRLRDWSIGRQRYWGCPIPVVYDQNGVEKLVPKEDLPVLLPQDLDLSSGMIRPLRSNLNFVNSAAEKYDEGWVREGDTMDTFVCSSWYFFRYCCDNFDNQVFASAEDLKKWMPVDQYIIGAEHSTMHLLYARFFTKVLFDAGYIDFEEPFLKVRHQGLILGPDNQKMSKSKGNVINPNQVYDEYGADTLRLYEMFMGPFDQPKPWNTSSIKGVKRFLDRVWKMQNLVNNEAKNTKLEVALHKLIKKVGDDIVNYSFNTAVAEYMKFVNLVEEISEISKDQFIIFLKVLAPFAPFITEELWQILQTKTSKADNQNSTETAKSTKEEMFSSIHQEPFPEYDSKMLVETQITIGVQINGKLRGEITLNTKESGEKVKELVMNLEFVRKYLDGKSLKKFIYIPQKVISLVVV